MTDNDRNYLKTEDAARWLGLSNATLRRFRRNGTGPAFHRFGTSVRYRRADLEAWAAAQRADPMTTPARAVTATSRAPRPG